MGDRPSDAAAKPLYTPVHIALAALLATPIAGALLAAKNLAAQNRHGGPSVVLLASTTVALCSLDLWGAGPCRALLGARPRGVCTFARDRAGALLRGRRPRRFVRVVVLRHRWRRSRHHHRAARALARRHRRRPRCVRPAERPCGWQGTRCQPAGRGRVRVGLFLRLRLCFVELADGCYI